MVSQSQTSNAPIEKKVKTRVPEQPDCRNSKGWMQDATRRAKKACLMRFLQILVAFDRKAAQSAPSPSEKPKGGPDEIPLEPGGL